MADGNPEVTRPWGDTFARHKDLAIANLTVRAAQPITGADTAEMASVVGGLIDLSKAVSREAPYLPDPEQTRVLLLELANRIAEPLGYTVVRQTGAEQ